MPELKPLVKYNEELPSDHIEELQVLRQYLRDILDQVI